MIPKEPITLKTEGQGRPFNMPERYPIEKNDEERQRPVPIFLGDLNGQDGGKGMPVNFLKRAGRRLESFVEYFTPDEKNTISGDDYDIQ